jgi:uncharacterized protein (TIGR02246 family)
MNREPSPADVYPALLGAFNAGDIEAILTCYEAEACFVTKSGREAHGADELRKLYRAMLARKPSMDLDVRRIIAAGNDLALVIVDWSYRTVAASGEIEALSGVATDVVRRQADGPWKLVLDNAYGIEQKDVAVRQI